jgi:FtsP/CotA-like multicopper oxidase with cupredoxin domain
LRVTVRNALSDTVWVRGLQDRPADQLTRVRLLPGAMHEFQFRATQPGTYYYAANKASQGNAWQPSTDFGPLAGAFIVDPPGSSTDDRVFVLTRWTRVVPGSPELFFEANTINGLSWPHTERLTLTEGEPVRWRVINPGNDPHLMHLHGFYFRVLSGGTESRDHIFAHDERPRAVTEFLGLGRTMSLEWTPEQVGNWIFHCHLVRHMSPDQNLERMPNAAGEQPHGADDAAHEMAGLIIGVTVQPAPGGSATAPTTPRRQLRLFANERPRVFGDRAGLGFVLQEGIRVPAPDSIRVPGSPLVLAVGEPTEIAVHNRTSRPLSVHWHGIELESYFDGVAGWSGTGDRRAPAIAKGDSFAVRITPRRAGTFIYHVHNERDEELASGLYGPLLVLPAGQKWNPEIDRGFLISEPGPGGRLGAERAPWVNGKNASKPIVLRLGTTYRLRFIAISANDIYIVRLEEARALAAHRRGLLATADSAATQAAGPVCRLTRDGFVLSTWRSVARDGADLTAEDRRIELACLRMGPGTTFDFEFTPDVPGALFLQVQAIDARNGQPGATTSVPIEVRER